jgi:transposase
MDRTLTMSYRDTERLKVISRVEHAELTVAEAAESLQISERQMYRILCRYRKEGDSGVVHRLRCRPSNVAYSASVRKQVLRLYRERYADYGPTLFAEKLDAYHDIQVSRQTLMRWLAGASLWSGTRKKRPHRKHRDRRSAIGALIQFDGSDHAWFEQRGPECCLLVGVDDASNRTFARFAPAEDTLHALSFWHQYVQRFGIPAEVYTDFDSVYHDNNGKQRLTQYGRAMTALGVTLIYAHSPQAKGRVERMNRTLQDRLLKALREHNISTIEEANLFLDSFFLDDFNARFANTDSLTDIHRSAQGIDLNNVFCFEDERHVYNDWTITLNAHYIQLLHSDAPLPPPRTKVIVHQWLDGSLHIFWNEQELAFKCLSAKPVRPRPVPRSAAKNHPWRKKLVGGITALRHAEKTLALKQHKQYSMPTQTKTLAPRRKASVRYAHSGFPSTLAAP